MKTDMKGLIVAFVLSCVSFNGFSQTIDTNAVDGRIYVRTVLGASLDLANYDSSNLVFNGILATYGVTDYFLPFPGLNNELDRTFEFVFTQWNQVDALITALELLPDVVYAEKKSLHRTTFVPNDVHASQWALANIQAADAWSITTGSDQIKIAVVDNAVSTLHEDLQTEIWVNSGEIPNNGLDDDLNGFIDDYKGYDVADGDNDPNPPAWLGSSSPFTHGTHCAGVASASTNNATGIASIGYNTTVIPVKCSPDSSPTEGYYMTNTFDGVYFAIQSDADIISMSFGTINPTITGESIISAASQSGIVLIAAAGNSSTSDPRYPAAYPNVISVGATNQSDMMASFSNYGSTIDVMAPGAGIYSTLSGNGNEYGMQSGTSMACPLVAGLAGLVLSQDPNRTPNEVELLLEAGCDPIDSLNPGYEGMLGAGRINAFATLDSNTIFGVEPVEPVSVAYPNPARVYVYLESDEALQKLEWVSLNGNSSEIPEILEFDGVYHVKTPPFTGIFILKAYYADRVEYHKVKVLQ